MAALVQTYPQQTATVTMLQTRPASSTSMIPNAQGQNGHQYATSAQTPRYAVPSPTGYRGSATPVQQYAFTSTPTLHHSQTWQPQAQPTRTYNHNTNYGGRQFSSSGANMQYNAMGVGQTGARDDSAIPQRRNIVPAPRPHSAFLAGPTQPVSPTSQSKAAPDRYRRSSLTPQQNQHGRSHSNAVNAGIPTANQLYNGPNPSRAAIPNRPNSFYNAVPGTSVDDMQLLQSPMDDSNRSRRRSIRADSDLSKPVAQDKSKTDGGSQNLRVVGKRTTHSRNGSSESVNSSRSSHSRPSSSANRNISAPTGNPSSQANNETTSKQDQAKVNAPPRGSSSDAIKRSTNPSPLSRPATMASEVAEDGSSNAQSAGNMESPAAKQLAAINKGRKSKSKTSRLRRAFSFGSAADFREAETPDKTEPSKLHKDPTTDEAYDAEQARIAEAQEAAGLGHSIYGGRFFGGSTDNLSISSTASSASIMIRKMGRGMKKGGRSFVGIFRPKSVIGVAPADGPVKPEASHAAVSMVTVEAETQRVNVSADPRQTDTFPHLERNSIDTSLGIDIAERLGSSGTDNSNSRKSIVGGDRERAEVLAAVRKGILKRPGSASPSIRPADSSPGLDLPSVPAVNDSPNSSAPSTPNDESQGHRRTGSIALGGEDYFMSALRLRQDSKSAPNTPHGSTKRNATFSPRIVFHDTWPPQEYDRRGEVATCNRLTPMLAQQIKEELNTFKMEMEVHENSKIYTHFF
ncbi:related to BNI4 Bud neck involved [Fusarium torulosum]|uniref:Related to BNI4 Bud neck involved n=1 Tax=Fusarium torulosum TaxID=33205 RepID=A0AAE8MBX1_9HYPO|nr:related to BNI4 Bud neck involved [Fusarium torulosum]